jgi:hypothetical protein
MAFVIDYLGDQSEGASALRAAALAGPDFRKDLLETSGLKRSGGGP